MTNYTQFTPTTSLLGGLNARPRQWMRRRAAVAALAAVSLVFFLVVTVFLPTHDYAHGWSLLNPSPPPSAQQQSTSASPQQLWLVENVFTEAAGTQFSDTGIFIEFGAGDGVYGSNSYAFERDLGWRGLLFEALPSQQQMHYIFGAERPRSAALDAAVCSSSRHVEFLDAAMDGYGGQVEHYDVARLPGIQSEAKVVRVACLPLAPLVDFFGIKRVNYMSVDTEGSELDALRGFPFDRVLVDVVGVEALVGTEERAMKERAIVEFMHGHGYRVLYRFPVGTDTFDIFFAPEENTRRALDRGLPFVDVAVFDAAKTTCKTLMRCL